jgi:hypothetical protein
MKCTNAGKLPLSYLLIVSCFQDSYSLVSNTSHQNSNTVSLDRRAFITRNGLNSFIATNIFKPCGVQAQDEKSESSITAQDRGGKPFAPPEALLPATRLKLWFDGIYTLSCNLSKTNDQNERHEIVLKMNSIFSDRPKLFFSEKIGKRTITPTAQLSTSVSSANKDQYQINRKGMGVGDKVAAMLNQADVERQWGMIQYAESKREETNEMRAAFNFYTRQLSFGDSYVLTASKEERKKMIRNDELPSLTAVITSDLDRRDLYRNQFLTVIEDAQAEVMYQSKQAIDQVDVLDIINLVNEANVAFENWFLLIAPEDVKFAIDTLS